MFTRPGTRGDLLAVRQRKGESMRQYIQRFNQVRNTIPRISPAAVIMAFSEGVTNKRLVDKLETHNCSRSRTSAPASRKRTLASSIGAR